MKKRGGFKVKSYKPGVIPQMQVGHLRRETADIGDYLNALNAARRPEHPNRQQWYKHVQSVMDDGHLEIIVEKRIMPVVNSRITIPGYENTDHIKRANAPFMKFIMRQLMLYKITGFRVLQVMPHTDPNQFFDVKQIPLHHTDHERCMVTKYPGSFGSGWSWVEGEQAPYLIPIGEPGELGKMVQQIPYVYYRRNNMGDWSQSNEKHASPTRVYFYDPQNPSSRKEVQRQAEDQGGMGYIIVPKGTELDLLESKANAGQGDAHPPFHDTLNNEITINLLGQVLTTSTDGKGSYALAAVHQEVEKDLSVQDKNWCLEQYNYVLAPQLATLGWQLPGYIEFDDTPKQSPKDRVEIFIKASQLVPISQNQVRTELHLEEATPEEEEEWLQARKAPAAPDPTEEETGKPKRPSPPGGGAKGGGGTKKKTSLSLSSQLTNHFGQSPWGDEGEARRGVELTDTDTLDAIVARLITEIHEGKVKPGQVDRQLYLSYATQLFAAVELGYGKKLKDLSSGPDHKMLTALRQNIFRFSSHKAFHFIREAFGQLVEDNQVKPFKQFREEVLSIHRDYNVNWLRTEYNVAVGNARMASIEQELQANKEAIPYAQVRVVQDDRTRHAKFHLVTLPVDHPFWRWGSPLYDYGCRCRKIGVVSGTITHNADLPSKDIVPEAFQFNAGTDKMLFSTKHPYFTVPHGHKGRAKQNFGMPKG